MRHHHVCAMMLGCLCLLALGRPAWSFLFTTGPPPSGTPGTMTPFVSGGVHVLDESVPLPFLSDLDFLGTGITCAPNLLANKIECSVPGGPGGGSSIILDLGDNGINESTALSEIAIIGDSAGVFTEPSADKLLINIGLLATVGQLNTHTGTTASVHGSTPSNTPNTLMQRDGAGHVAATTMTATTFLGDLGGNASSATAAAANGGNCGVGLAARGVNTLWEGEDCFDVLTQAEGDLKQDLVTAGAGLANTGATFRTASTEVDFLTDGGTTSLTCGANQQGKMQVMDSGELQYCGGETTPALHAGLPTQTGLSWNVTPSGCTGDGAGGALTVNGSNQIICSADDGGAGGSGDVTAVGNCTTGACLDGNSGGGSNLALYDGDSHKGTFQTANLTADRIYTFPNDTGLVPLTSGTPSAGQVAEWTSSSAIQGVNTTGTGNYVRDTAPTIANGNLGTPSAINLANATGLTLAQMPAAVRAAVAVSMARMGGF